MNPKMKHLLIIILFIFLPFLSKINAQEKIVLEPLFEYPVAPEELESMSERCDYLVTHFWDNFDLKQKNAVDQNALNHAFNVYITSLSYSNAKNSLPEVEKLLKQLSKNHVLLTQFVKAAEENLYGVRADYWNDDLYLKFLDVFFKNKDIPEQRKTKYRKQYDIINTSKLGGKMPQFIFTDKNNKEGKYFPMSTPTLLIFGDPSDPDWRFSRLKMETNIPLSQALDRGKVNILYIVSTPLPEWTNETKNYPEKWTIGKNDEIGNIVDIRLNPSVYLVGSDSNIILKNSELEMAITRLLDLVNE